MNMDQSPQSPEGQAHNAPHNYEEEETPQDNDYQPQGQLQYEDVSMDEDKNDPPEENYSLAKRSHGIKRESSHVRPQIPKICEGQRR